MQDISFMREVVLGSRIIPSRFRHRLLSIMGIKIGPGASVAYGAILKGNGVTIGAGSFVNHNVYVDRGALTIGDNVNIGPGVTFATRNHSIGSSSRRAGEHMDQPISVESGTWIGANATILGNVNIGEGCIIAAGAVVAEDTLANGLYAGVPAKFIRSLE